MALHGSPWFACSDFIILIKRHQRQSGKDFTVIKTYLNFIKLKAEVILLINPDGRIRFYVIRRRWWKDAQALENCIELEKIAKARRFSRKGRQAQLEAKHCFTLGRYSLGTMSTW